MSHWPGHQIPYTLRVSYLKELLYSHKHITILNYPGIRPLIIFLIFQVTMLFWFSPEVPLPIFCYLWIHFFHDYCSFQEGSLLPALCIFVLTQAAAGLRALHFVPHQHIVNIFYYYFKLFSFFSFQVLIQVYHQFFLNFIQERYLRNSAIVQVTYR